MKYKKNEWAELWVDGNLLVINYFQGVIVDSEVAKCMLRDRLALSEGKFFYVHCDCRGVKYWTGEARKFNDSAENAQLVIAATVLYTESSVANIVINFYLKFSTFPYPFRFCKSEQEAMKWLSTFKDFALSEAYDPGQHTAGM